MTRWKLALWTVLVWAAACSSGCGDGMRHQPTPEPTRGFGVIATQNVGTTPFLKILAASPHRQACEEWYDNNLCTMDVEVAFGAVVQADRPDVLMLQEVWDQRRCDEPRRPEEARKEPYACALGKLHQLERILPVEYHYACATGYPDNCIAFLPDVFVPEADDATATGAERDQSGAMRPVQADCGRPGRIAWLRGQSTSGTTVLVVVHTNAGFSVDDGECRGLQLAALRSDLMDLPADAAIFVAGDFNFDPSTAEGPDADALAALVEDLSLVRLRGSGPTHRLLKSELDHIWVRGWQLGEKASCQVIYPDEADAVPMFDHGYVTCTSGPRPPSRGRLAATGF